MTKAEMIETIKDCAVQRQTCSVSFGYAFGTWSLLPLVTGEKLFLVRTGD